MKTVKFILVAIALLPLVQSGYAENDIKNQNPSSSSGAHCFDENSRVINLGIGVGSGGYYRGSRNGHYSQSPAFSISYEQPWKQKLGPGFLGVGGYFGFQTAKNRYEYTNYYNNHDIFFYENRWKYFTLGGRAAYHWDVLNKEKAELYAGVILGARFQTYDYTSNDPNDNHRISEGAVWPAYAGFVGGRYYFQKNFGVFFEAGFGISFGTIGLSLKF